MYSKKSAIPVIHSITDCHIKYNKSIFSAVPEPVRYLHLHRSTGLRSLSVHMLRSCSDRYTLPLDMHSSSARTDT